jgi:GNAT superfamily N-acetyltransferase
MTARFINILSEEQTWQLHALYQHEWWSQDRTLEETRRMLSGGSLVFGLAHPENGALLAFARVITDHVFKGLLFDVIVHPDHRGDGLGSALMRHIFSHPVLLGVKHLELYCLPERAGYYEALGFSADVLKDLILMRRIQVTDLPP